MTNYIFVYGTLKRGCHNHSLLQGCSFICEGTSKGTALLDLGGCPGMVLARSPRTEWARGEVFLAPDIEAVLKRLDRLESEGTFYKRIVLDVTPLYHGEPYTGSPDIACHTYIYMPAFSTDYIEGGNWEMPPLGRYLPAT